MKSSGHSRRAFMIRAATIGCSAAASPLLTPLTLAAVPSSNARLVVIILRGGMDGLDVVRPVGDPLFKPYRPTLSDSKGAVDLNDGFFMLNSNLAPLLPLWHAGELGFAHAVATPYRNKRSHFDGQDILEAGVGRGASGVAVRTGWLNRMLSKIPGATAKTAFSVGNADMMILDGSAPISSWSPNSRLDLSSHSRHLLEVLYHDDPVFHAASNTALDLAQPLDGGGGSDKKGALNIMMKAMLKAGRPMQAKSLAKFAAERMNEDTRIASFSIGGWDTHLAQSAGLRRPLSDLSDAILMLKKTLGKNWQNTTVLAMTEFGRTARENGSQGTDHGTGGVMLFAGGATRGGKIYGKWPGLGENDLYQNRDLLPTRDVRAYGAYVMRGLFGLKSSTIESGVFPGLEMGADPRILL